MRLWHKDLISVLPDKQLVSQWRECCCIARNISVNGTPNHILVNKILDYPIEHFHFYACEIADEMERRGYKCDYTRFDKWMRLNENHCTHKKLFNSWHTDRYLRQCYYNLQEKYDCGGISEDEWHKVQDKFDAKEK